MPHVLRTGLYGFAELQDRLWRISGPGFVVGLTDYNWEITGFAPLLRSLFPRGVVCYSGNAYYVLRVCRERGYTVEQIEDRNVSV